MVENVLLATPRWTRDGGVGAHVQSSAAALARHGVCVTVVVARVEEDEGRPGVTTQGTPNEQEPPSVTAQGQSDVMAQGPPSVTTQGPPDVTVIEAPRLFDAGAPLDERLAGALSCGPDAVHLHQLDDPALVAALRAHAPVVVSAHAYTACASGVHYFKPGRECTRAHGPGCVASFALRGCAHTRHPKTLPAKYRNAGRGVTALREADLAVAYSRAVEHHLAANGIARRRVVPLFPTLTLSPAASHPLAVPASAAEPAPSAGAGAASAREHTQPTREHTTRPRVVFAGRIDAPKGVDVLLRAVRTVDAELVICGDGRRLEAMRRLARRLGIERRVHFRGWLGADALAGELAGATVVAIPSRWPEPFGLVGIEALAAGRPVVASLAGGVRDWLDDGVTGLGVPPADPHSLARALQQLLTDPERCRAMGEAGREAVAARFSPERHVAALMDGYAAARARTSASVRQ
ncbi:MAG TPA: glycosyltransferase [Solirubrobacteraceae bacterium]|nr:glycosyltransferase [Solirubrobacteraceae bacterium]